MAMRSSVLRWKILIFTKGTLRAGLALVGVGTEGRNEGENGVAEAMEVG
jgi:hypothetical protein